MALPQESRGRLEAAGADLLYTGVGKVNAAMALTRRLTELRLRGGPTATWWTWKPSRWHGCVAPNTRVSPAPST